LIVYKSNRKKLSVSVDLFGTTQVNIALKESEPLHCNHAFAG